MSENLTPVQKAVLLECTEKLGEHFDGWVLIALPDIRTPPVTGYGGGLHQALGLMDDYHDSLVRRVDAADVARDEPEES